MEHALELKTKTDLKHFHLFKLTYQDIVIVCFDKQSLILIIMLFVFAVFGMSELLIIMH